MSSVAFQISAIFFAPSLQNVPGAEHRAIVLHGPLHAEAQFRRGRTAGRLAETVEPRDRRLAGIPRQVVVRRIGLDVLDAFKPAARPKTTRSISEFEPRRLAP